MTASKNWKLAPAREAFPQVATLWGQINETLRSAHPLLDPRFVGPLISHFAGPEELLAHYERCGEHQLILCSPRKPLMWSSFLPSQAQIAPALLSNGERVDSLLNTLPGRPVAFEMYCQDPLFTPFEAERERPALDFKRHAVTTNIDLDGDFERYWASRSKKLRQNIGRYERRAAADIGEVRMTAAEAPVAVVEGLARYGDIESAGWKGAAGTAVHSENAQGRFYAEVLSRFAETGNATVYELYIGDTLAASRLTISSGAMLVMLKTTYDENLAKYAPGRILLFKLLQEEFARGRFKTIEFYTNAPPELVTWSTGTRVINHVTVYRNRLVERLSRIYRTAKAYRRAPPPAQDDHAYRNRADTIGVECFTDFRSLPSSGTNLVKKISEHSVFLTLQWFENFIGQVAAGDGEVRIYTARHSNGKVTGLLPLWLRDETNWLKIRAMHSLANYYTAEFSLITDAEAYDEKGTIAALVSMVCADAAQWDMLTLSPMANDALCVPALARKFRKRGMIVSLSPAFTNWYTPLEGASFDDYFARRPSMLRNTTRRRMRKLQRECNTTTKIYTSLDGLDPAIKDYETVYRVSWKRAEPYPDFIRELIRMCAENKWLRLGILYIDEQPAAAQIWIVYNATASIFKLAFDPRYANYSVGTLLSMQLMEHVIDTDRVAVVDFLTGDDPYKENWMSHKRERISLEVFNPGTVKGKMLISRRVAGDMFRRATRTPVYHG